MPDAGLYLMLEVIPGATKLVEGFGGTTGGLGRVLRDLLGEYPHFRGVGDVLLVVLTVLVNDEQYHNEQDGKCNQRCDQAGNQFVASLSHTESSGSVFHFLAPGLFLLEMASMCSGFQTVRVMFLPVPSPLPLCNIKKAFVFHQIGG